MGGIVGAAAAGAQCVAPGSPRVLTPNSALSPRVLTIIIFFLHRAHLSCPPVTTPGPPPEQLVYCLTSGWMHHYHYLRTTFLPATTPLPPSPTHTETRALCSPSDIYFLLQEGRGLSVSKHTWLLAASERTSVALAGGGGGDRQRQKRPRSLCFLFCLPLQPQAFSRNLTLPHCVSSETLGDWAFHLPP